MAKSKYRDDFPELARKYAEEGMIDEEIAKKLCISHETFYKYQKQYPEFLEAIKEGKRYPNLAVEAAALKSAEGYTETLTQQRVLASGEIVEYKQQVHYPPNSTSLIFWLVNRMPDRWRSVNKDQPQRNDDEPTASDILKALAQSTPTRYAIPIANGSSKIQDSASGKAERQD